MSTIKKNKNNPKTPDNINSSSKVIHSNSKSPLFPPIETNKTNNSFRKHLDISTLNNKGINNNINMNYNPSGNINPNYLGFLPNIPYTVQSYQNGSAPNLDFNNDSKSENIKVCVRIRPLSPQELGRGDKKSVEPHSSDQLIYNHKNIRRSYTYNLVFGENSSQEDIFYNCSINKLLDNAMDGYSVTIFAYGQTGSGKTYTIMGRDDSINEKILSNDKYSGIMPKSIKYIWSAVKNRKEKYYIKVSFLEIYNEQINDLLDPGHTNLQIRWDQKQGFFVEGLLVIECKKPEDIVEIILQGTKNRKKGSHDLNKDSSRSHSILTVYLISEFISAGESYKKYGKISFVDLAGSERLKETHSKGGMIKETGNINKSLFVLGKVISSLTDKKNTNQHIPYRDSKLTMLLMDSIGGTAKTLMIACVSPSSVYSDETMSTLNYASRTMNIKNKPLVQMDAREKAREDLEEENEMYISENEFLKGEFMKLLGMIPKMANGGLTEEDIENYKIAQGFRSNEELDKEIEKLKIENDELKNVKEKQMKENMKLSDENNALNSKLINLENVFIGSDLINKQDSTMANIGEKNYNISAIMVENTELKKTIDKLEMDKIQLQEIIAKGKNPGIKIYNEGAEFDNMKEQNNKLVRRVEFLQKRERELLETIMKLKMENNV
jgi:hypothetical protein